MTRWFEEVENNPSNIVFSRVRLSRNWEEYKFPGRLEDREAGIMIGRIKTALQGISDLDGREYEYIDFEGLEELERLALRERRIINRSFVEKTTPGGIILSEDESISLMLNGDDHIRIQILAPGLHVKECYDKADCLDDFINETISYAYNSKYGYLTSYPTNVGTGMKASIVVHLPSLSLGRRFQDLLEDMSRFGTTVRGLYGRSSENAGDLYEVFNQKTLGVNEHEILELVTNAASQLSEQENQVRQKALEKHRLIREDEVYKSYGVLKYARRLAMKDAMTFLSHLMTGIADGLIVTKEPCSIYRLMMDIQPANLQQSSKQPLDQEELESARAGYLRTHLPELK
ncbi:MAG: ATP--guanido phosphotransferase [Clostridium sp.]